jgi:hypothetical protein
MKSTLIIIAILIGKIVISQEKTSLNITESEVFKDQVQSDSIQSAYSLNNDGLLIVRADDKKVFVDIFEKQLTNRSTYAIELGKEDTYVGDIFYDNTVSIISENIVKKSTSVLSRYTFDLDSKSTSKKELSRTSIDKKLSLYSNKKGSNYAISPNSEFIGLVIYTIHKGEIYFTVSVFDTSDFTLIYEKQIKRSENKFYSIEDVQVDNNNNVYVLGKTFFESDNPQIKNEDKQHYFLEKFTVSDYSKLDINYSDKYAKSLKTRLSGDSYNLYGFYSDRNVIQNKGLLNVSIDLNQLKIIKTNFQNIPDKVYRDIFGFDKDKKEKSIELSNFDINHILQDNDESLYLLAEESYTNYSAGAPIPTGTASGGQTIYSGGSGGNLYGDILIIKIDKSQVINWGRGIYKSSSQPSYNAFLQNNELHVLLNSGKDLKQLKDGRIKVSKGLLESSSLYDFKFNTSGNNSIIKIQDNKNNDYYLPFYGKEVNQKFIMFNDSRKKRKFLMIK